MQLLYVGEDNLIELANVRNAATGALVSNLDVTAQLFEADAETELGDEIDMPTTAAGVYQGTLPYTVAVLPGVEYWLVISATGGITGSRRIKCRGAYHQEDI